jgi:3-deoxy-D-manno-octulosonic-acid transferase
MALAAVGLPPGALTLRALYTLLLRAVAPVAIALAWWRGWRRPQLRIDIAQRLAIDAQGVTASAPLWIHAVSVGEVQASAGLVNALHVTQPDLPLLLTTATPTGMALARRLFASVAELRYAPFDLPGAARRFLQRTRPRAALFVETELWPNLIAACVARGVPVALVSARVSQRSLERYLRFAPGLMRSTVGSLATIAAQTQADAVRFAQLGAGAGRVQVTGNIKFDLRLPGDLRARAALLGARYAGRRLWVAGSTHAGEEELLLDAQQALARTAPDTLLILVPRHPQRFDAVAQLLASRGVEYLRHSSGLPLQPQVRVVLVDSVGELLQFYALADVAFVGGTLVPVGGHNLLEPAALAVPVLCGPHTFNAPDVARLLFEAGAVQCVSDATTLEQQLARLLGDAPARQRMGAAGSAVVEANRGAVSRTLAATQSLLRATAVPDSAPAPPAVP